MTAEPRAVRALASGRVQGVGFRHATASEAARLGLAGWVRNVSDGRVEAHAEGAPESVAALLAWLRAGGPPLGRVTSLDVDEVAVLGARGFDVRTTA